MSGFQKISKIDRHLNSKNPFENAADNYGAHRGSWMPWESNQNQSVKK